MNLYALTNYPSLKLNLKLFGGHSMGQRKQSKAEQMAKAMKRFKSRLIPTS